MEIETGVVRLNFSISDPVITTAAAAAAMTSTIAIIFFFFHSFLFCVIPTFQMSFFSLDELACYMIKIIVVETSRIVSASNKMPNGILSVFTSGPKFRRRR